MKLSTKVVLLTFLGGAIGTLGRYSLGLIPEYFFVNFWAANLLGVVLIAVFNNLAWYARDDRRAFFVVGLTGGFTTMSGLSALMLYSWVEVIAQAIIGVVLYLAVSLLIRRFNRV